MGFSHTIQMFSKENEKKVTVFLLFDRIERKGVGFTLYLYMRARGKLSMIPLWVFLRFESAGLSLLLSK